jgi:hypothetical protein
MVKATRKFAITLTAARLKELLDYNPETGVFINRMTRGPKAVVGMEAGTLDDLGYRYITLDYDRFQASHLAWLYVHGQWPQGEMDHRDRKPGNNAIANLREAARAQNCQNGAGPRSHNKSGYRGVSWHKIANKWIAQIVCNKVHHYLGLFDDPKEAHEAYCAASIRLHGEWSGVRNGT